MERATVYDMVDINIKRRDQLQVNCYVSDVLVKWLG